jgi:5-formyltetrahydrofolate cyclo-ligase
LRRSRFGVLEPSPDRASLAPDIVLVPLLGFDRAGHRIGYGQGHYDRTLSALRARGPVLAIGLAFAAQETPDALAQGHDQRLDAVLTPDGVIECA